MANSKFEYVKNFEQPDNLLLNTWIVVRIDGRGFTKFSSKYGFEKPNDRRALDLMNAAAQAVMYEIPEVTIAYGISDEYRLRLPQVMHPLRKTLNKLVTTIVSTFSSYYIHLWSIYFPDTPLSPPLPSFDGRAVCYPSVQNLRDYMSWRQVDCHINNLYNTTFWALIQKGGMGNLEAEELLKGTYAADKNEILFSKFGINYNNEPEIYKKGSVVFRGYELVDPATHNAAAEADSLAEPIQQSKNQTESDKKRRAKARIVIEHLDIIKDEFWDRRPWLLSNKPGKVPKET
ncbi:Putative tRNA(His) guanylyltransferase [Podospora comata]|uniref:tRNA(His) guanylyltransferase n=1 Tax=Podospora comata TaxID=48703 RepID=A0ABY6RTQ2_PODCO|nr:Putative tRNA(His) guanylyltransferase [Podospora comata]